MFLRKSYSYTMKVYYVVSLVGDNRCFTLEVMCKGNFYDFLSHNFAWLFPSLILIKK